MKLSHNTGTYLNHSFLSPSLWRGHSWKSVNPFRRIKGCCANFFLDTREYSPQHSFSLIPCLNRISHSIPFLDPFLDRTPTKHQTLLFWIPEPGSMLASPRARVARTPSGIVYSFLKCNVFSFRFPTKNPVRYSSRIWSLIILKIFYDFAIHIISGGYVTKSFG